MPINFTSMSFKVGDKLGRLNLFQAFFLKTEINGNTCAHGFDDALSSRIDDEFLATIHAKIKRSAPATAK